MRKDDDNLHRKLVGCTVTVENMRTGRMISWHIEGERGAALRNAADRIDRLGPAWKVVSYSTPQTIRSDLASVRVQSDVRHPGAIEAPETMMCSRIGRVDLVHPRLVGGVARQSRHHGRAR